MTSNWHWQKSSHSNPSGNCVEVGKTSHSHERVIMVRDTQDRTGPVLTFGADGWARFLDWIGRYPL